MIDESGFNEKLNDFILRLKNNRASYEVEVTLGDSSGRHIEGVWNIKYKANKIFAKSYTLVVKTEGHYQDGSPYSPYLHGDKINNPNEDLSKHSLSFVAHHGINPDTKKDIFNNGTDNVDEFFNWLDEAFSFMLYP